MEYCSFFENARYSDNVRNKKKHDYKYIIFRFIRFVDVRASVPPMGILPRFRDTL